MADQSGVSGYDGGGWGSQAYRHIHRGGGTNLLRSGKVTNLYAPHIVLVTRVNVYTLATDHPCSNLPSVSATKVSQEMDLVGFIYIMRPSIYIYVYGSLSQRDYNY